MTIWKPPDATLLLVDDDPVNRDLLARRLHASGYEVVTADSGAQAIEVVNRQRVDAVLLDVMMPGMSGLETLRRLRETRSLTELPVIMITGNHHTDDVVEALDLGANDYVTKPVDFPVVLARIRTQVASRRADPLTGLPNRVLFMEHVDRVLSRARAAGRDTFAVMFLDVDRFKIVNDSLGHLAGDELLVAVARRLHGSLRATDTVARFTGEATIARFGGDEFTILLDGVPGLSEAETVAERLLAVLTLPFDVQGREVFTSVSIGVVMGAARYKNAEDLVRDADTAMYRAKARGKARFEVFDLSMLQAVEEQLQLESDLRRALERGEFRLHYQPIVSLDEGRLCGFEALLRWQHPTRGLMAPAEFIGLAEETGLILPIGRWTLHEACRQMIEWDGQYSVNRPLSISVNLSARQCRDTSLVHDVAHVLQETGLSSERLKLEVPEMVLFDHADAVLALLTDVRALGVHLGLDDFGMGYSALSYLRRFPFQTMKIDRSFVSAMQDSGSAEIVRAIVSLAGSLALGVSAEGVETAEQAAGLKRLACDFGQGYYFHKPLPSSDVAVMLGSDRGQTPLRPSSDTTPTRLKRVSEAGQATIPSSAAARKHLKPHSEPGLTGV